ncbi:MarR family transcriptional regulator [Vulcanisaeta thermophila]|uniref:MarR family transcriptional regulator n=1 Tax=Vulcanisaeta thermophila TaxID=867917 RepID=UPI00085334A9|nr:MarR family transcriptional regulator [Vulcanisaeta thermophila]
MPAELSDREKLVLRIIGDACDKRGQDRVTLEDISEGLRRSGLTPTDAMDVIYKLEDKGLVRTEMLGYTTVIYITDTGREVYRGLK